MPKRALVPAAALLVVVGLVASFSFPTEGRDGGGRSLDGWWLFEWSLAAAAVLVTRRFAAWRTALLVGGLLLGMSAQLALTRPHWLQILEMRPAYLTTRLGLAAVGSLGLQLALVVAGVAAGWGNFLQAAQRLVSRTWLLAVPLFALLAGAHLSVFLPRFPEPFWIAAYLAQLGAGLGFLALNVTHLWLLARSLPPAPIEELGRWAAARWSLPGSTGSERPWDRWVPRVCAAFALLASATIALVVFERLPHVQDESAYLFHARTFALGEVSTPAPDDFDAHAYYLIDQHEGRWYATTKPGWPAVLAVGVLLGVPWLVNPILGGLCVLALHALTLRLTRDRGVAHLVALLTATSPWYLFLAASLMGHTLPLFATVLGFLLVDIAVQRSAGLAALAAGACFGLGVLVRPVDGLVVGTLAGIWILLRRGITLRLLLPYATSCVATTLPMLAYNQALIGSPLADPMQRYIDRIWFPGANRMGFGDDIGPPNLWGNLDYRRGHDLFEVVLNANQNLYNIHFELLGWAYLGLVPLLAHLCWTRWTSLERRLTAATALLIAALSLYWFSGGPDFGARYWFLAFLPLVIWSAQGLVTASKRLQKMSGDASTPLRMAVTVGLLVVVSLFVFLPWRSVARYVEYRDLHADYRRLEVRGALERAVVLVEADSESEIESALLHNRPDLPSDRPIFVRARTGAELQDLRQAYPDRPLKWARGRAHPDDEVQLLDLPPAATAAPASAP